MLKNYSSEIQIQLDILNFYLLNLEPYPYPFFGLKPAFLGVTTKGISTEADS